MNNLFKLTNYIINSNQKKYTKRILNNSSYFKAGKKECKTRRDSNIMLCRDISTITDEEINKRQEKIKVNLILICAYYMMLIYFAIKFCA